MSAHSAEVAADFKDALQDLKVNSRPEISNLTIIAKENTEHAQAISRELETHIRTARPECKLPALYVLDSIVKNVGTPYTVYLGRDLYRTFMDAYVIMDSGTRKAMEGLLKTWKQPVPESMDARPVFQPEVTRDIENALIKFRTVAVQQQALSQKPGPQHSMPARPMPNMPWGNTPTPPQNVGRFTAPNDPRRQPFLPAQNYGQFPAPGTPVQYPPTQPSPQPVSSIDLEQLKADLARLIATTKDNFASNPSNVSTQAQLKALLGLETILRTQTLLPQQLEQIRNQIQLSSRPPPAPTPAFVPQVSAPPPLFPGHQQPPLPNFPPGLAQLLANTKPPVPSPSSTPVPAALSLADMLRTVTTPSQSSSAPPPSVTPFYAPSYASIPPPVSTPVPPPAPAPTTGTPSANLAQLLARFNPPPAPAPTSTQPLPLPPFLAQLPPPPPAHGSGDWLINALKGFGAPGTPANSTPMASEPIARQASAPNTQNAVELTTASIKMPRLHLISKLYEAVPNQCVTCGRRFESTPEGREKKARHMDWHFKVKDPDAAKRGIHRSWYISEKDWIEYKEVDETSPNQAVNGAPGTAAVVKKETKDKYVPVPDIALGRAPCPICQEEFSDHWLVEENDFVWMDAVKVNGRIYHATCWEEYSKGAGIATPSTPDSVLGKRKAEGGGHASRVRAW